MGCKELPDREGKEIPEVTGKNKKPATILKAVDISDICPDLDLDTRVVLSYVRDAGSHLKVYAAIETENGILAKWWQLRKVKKGVARLHGFKNFAHKVTLSQVVLANLIITKAPKGT